MVRLTTDTQQMAGDSSPHANCNPRNITRRRRHTHRGVAEAKKLLVSVTNGDRRNGGPQSDIDTYSDRQTGWPKRIDACVGLVFLARGPYCGHSPVRAHRHWDDIKTIFRPYSMHPWRVTFHIRLPENTGNELIHVSVQQMVSHGMPMPLLPCHRG